METAGTSVARLGAAGFAQTAPGDGGGAEWCDAEGGLHRMAPMQVGLFKGNRHPDRAPRIRHRSPPVSHLPPARRARLLLCIDETGVFE